MNLLSAKDKITLIRAVSGRIEKGNSPRDVLIAMIRETKGASRRMLQDCAKSIDAGGSLSQGLQSWLSKSECSLLAQYENEGKLGIGGKTLAEKLEANSNFTGGIMKLVAYPAFLAGLLIMAYGTFVFHGFLPSLDGITGLFREIPSEFTTMKQLSTHFNATWYLYLLSPFVFYFLFAFLLPNWSGGVRNLFDKAPVFSAYRRLQGSNIIFGVSRYVDAGTPWAGAVKKFSQNENRYTKFLCKELERGIVGGLNPANAFIRLDLLRPLSAMDMRAASVDELVQVCQEVADYEREAAIDLYNKIAGIVRMLLWLILGYLIITMVGGILSIARGAQGIV